MTTAGNTTGAEDGGTAMTIDGRPWQRTTPDAAGAAETTPRPPAGYGVGTMERYLFFGRVIDTLARGSSFRAWFSRFLKVAAAGIAFAGLVALFNAWQFTARQEASGIVGGIVYMLFLVAGVYMVVHATTIRAGHIESLPDGEFTLIPVCAVLTLLIGEAYAALFASLSVGGGLLIWFTRGSAYNLLNHVSAFVPVRTGTDFLAGTLFMVRGLVGAVVILTMGYLASELFLVIARIGERPDSARASIE